MTPPPPPTSPHLLHCSSSSGVVLDPLSSSSSSTLPPSPSDQYSCASPSSNLSYSSSAYHILPPRTTVGPPLSCRPVSLPSLAAVTATGVGLASKHHPPLLRHLLDSALPLPPSSQPLSALLLPRLSDSADDSEEVSSARIASRERGASPSSSSSVTRRCLSSSSSQSRPFPSQPREEKEVGGVDSPTRHKKTSPAAACSAAEDGDASSSSSSPRSLCSRGTNIHGRTSSPRKGQPGGKSDGDRDDPYKGSIEAAPSSSPRRSPSGSRSRVSSSSSPPPRKGTGLQSVYMSNAEGHGRFERGPPVAPAPAGDSSDDADHNKKQNCYRDSPLLRRAARHSSRSTGLDRDASHGLLRASSCGASQPVWICPFLSLLERSANSLQSDLSSSVLRCKTATLQKDRLLRTAGVAIYRAVRAHALNILNIIEAQGTAAVGGALRRRLGQDFYELHGFESREWRKTKARQSASPGLLPFDEDLASGSREQTGGVHAPQSLLIEAASDRDNVSNDDQEDGDLDEDEEEEEEPISWFYGREGRRRGRGHRQSSIFEFLPVIVASAGVYAADHRLAVQVLLLESIQRSMNSWRRHLRNERKKKKGLMSAQRRAYRSQDASLSPQDTQASSFSLADQSEGYFFFRYAVLRPSDCTSIAAALRSIHRQFSSPSTSSVLPPSGGDAGQPFPSTTGIKASLRSSSGRRGRDSSSVFSSRSPSLVGRKDVSQTQKSAAPPQSVAPRDASREEASSFSPSKARGSSWKPEKKTVKEEEENDDKDENHDPNTATRSSVRKKDSALSFYSSSSCPPLLRGPDGEEEKKKGAEDLAAMAAWENPEDHEGLGGGCATYPATSFSSSAVCLPRPEKIIALQLGQALCGGEGVSSPKEANLSRGQGGSCSLSASSIFAGYMDADMSEEDRARGGGEEEDEGRGGGGGDGRKGGGGAHTQNRKSSRSVYEELSAWWRALDLYSGGPTGGGGKQQGRGQARRERRRGEGGGARWAGAEARSAVRTRRQRKHEDMWRSITSSEEEEEEKEVEEEGEEARNPDFCAVWRGVGEVRKGRDSSASQQVQWRRHLDHDGLSPSSLIKEEGPLLPRSREGSSTPRELAFFQPVSFSGCSPPPAVGSAALLVVIEETEAFPPQLLTSLLQCLHLLREKRELPLIVLTVVSSSAWGRQCLSSDVYTARGLAVETATLLRPSLIQEELLRVIMTCPVSLGFDIPSPALECLLRFIEDEAPSVLQVMRLLLGVIRCFFQFHPLAFLCRGLDDVYPLLRDLEREEREQREEEEEEEREKTEESRVAKSTKKGTEKVALEEENKEEEGEGEEEEGKKKKTKDNNKKSRRHGSLPSKKEQGSGGAVTAKEKGEGGGENDKEEEDEVSDGPRKGKEEGKKDRVKKPNEERKKRGRAARPGCEESPEKRERECSGEWSVRGRETSFLEERDENKEEAVLTRLCAASYRFVKRWKRRFELLCFCSLTENYMRLLAQLQRGTFEVYVHLVAAQKNGFFFFDRCCWEHQQLQLREEGGGCSLYPPPPPALSRASPLARRSRPFEEEEDEEEVRRGREQEDSKQESRPQQTREAMKKEDEKEERKMQRTERGGISASRLARSISNEGKPSSASLPPSASSSSFSSSSALPVAVRGEGGEQDDSSSCSFTSLRLSTPNPARCGTSLSWLPHLEEARRSVCRRSAGCVSRLAVLDLLQRWWGGRGLLFLHRLNENAEEETLVSATGSSSVRKAGLKKDSLSAREGGGDLGREEDAAGGSSSRSWVGKTEAADEELRMALLCKETLPTALMELTERRIGLCLGRRLLFLLDQTLQHCTRQPRATRSSTKMREGGREGREEARDSFLANSTTSSPSSPRKPHQPSVVFSSRLSPVSSSSSSSAPPSPLSATPLRRSKKAHIHLSRGAEDMRGDSDEGEEKPEDRKDRRKPNKGGEDEEDEENEASEDEEDKAGVSGVGSEEGERDEEEEEEEGFLFASSFSPYDCIGDEEKVPLSSSRHVIVELDEILGVHEETPCRFSRRWNPQHRIQEMARAIRQIEEGIRRLVVSKYDKLAVAAPAARGGGGGGGGGGPCVASRRRSSPIHRDESPSYDSMTPCVPGEGNFADPQILASMLEAFLRQSRPELHLLHRLFYSSYLSVLSANKREKDQDNSAHAKVGPSSLRSPKINLHALEVLRLFQELPSLTQDLLGAPQSSSAPRLHPTAATPQLTPLPTQYGFAPSFPLTRTEDPHDLSQENRRSDADFVSPSVGLDGCRRESTGASQPRLQQTSRSVAPQFHQLSGSGEEGEHMTDGGLCPEGGEGEYHDDPRERSSPNPTKTLVEARKDELEKYTKTKSTHGHDDGRKSQLTRTGAAVDSHTSIVSLKTRVLRWLEEALLLLLLPLPGWHPFGSELAVWGGSLGIELALSTGVLSSGQDSSFLRTGDTSVVSAPPSASSVMAKSQLAVAAKSVGHMLRPHPQSEMLEHLAMINPFFLQQFQISSSLSRRKKEDARHLPSTGTHPREDASLEREVCLEDLVILYRLINGEASGRRVGMWDLFCGFCRDVLRDRVQQERLKRQRGSKTDAQEEAEDNDDGDDKKSSTEDPWEGGRKGAGQESEKERSKRKKQKDGDEKGSGVGCVKRAGQGTESKKKGGAGGEGKKDKDKREEERKFVLAILQQMEEEGNRHTEDKGRGSSGSSSSSSSRDNSSVCTPGNREGATGRRGVGEGVHAQDDEMSAGDRKATSRASVRRDVSLLQQLQLRFAIAVGALDQQLGVLRLPGAHFLSAAHAGTERSLMTGADAAGRNDELFSSGNGLGPDFDEEDEREEDGKTEREKEEGAENEEQEGEEATGRKMSEPRRGSEEGPGRRRTRRRRGLATRTSRKEREDEEEEGGSEVSSEDARDEKEEGRGGGEVEEELRRMRDLMYGLYAQRTQFGVVYVPDRDKDEKQEEEDDEWNSHHGVYDEDCAARTSRKRRRKQTKNTTKQRGRRLSRRARRCQD